ncbi:MAG: dTDP-4-amino-4,6-dideoxygalactose transaminase [Oscillospiraceae bacterium]|nr:dTDP-4-amino-4,6-dideoxygalactose transaminase [Oscillospiraceae bacterium]
MREAALGSICGDGPFTKRATSLFMEKTGLSCALLTTSCTHALELSALLAGVGAGDEVILPSFTFSSTANAFILRGAKLRFCEIDPSTMNADAAHMASLVNDRTKVLAPIDYAGVACDIDAMNDIAKKHGLTIVQDAAQAVGSRYKGRPVGADADFACYSFHETKNYVMGEGGAIHIKDPKLYERAEILREKGTDRSRFWRGEVDKYSWHDLGSSFLPSDILAAMLLGQLTRFEEILKKRMYAWDFFDDGLKDLESAGKLRRPVIPQYAQHNAHLFYIILNSSRERDELHDYLREKGVGAVIHYVPLHSSSFGLAMGNKPEDLPLTEDRASRLLRLPLYPDLKEEECSQIVNSVKGFF